MITEKVTREAAAREGPSRREAAGREGHLKERAIQEGGSLLKCARSLAHIPLSHPPLPPLHLATQHTLKMPEACPNQLPPEQLLMVLFQQYVPALQMEPAEKK